MGENYRLPYPPKGDKIVAVIGAGITGVLTTLALLKSGYSVTLVEKKFPGNGSTTRSAACVRMQWPNEQDVKAMMYGINWYERFCELTDSCSPAIQQNGYLYPFWYKDKWKERQSQAKMQQELGAPVEILNRENVLRRFPYIQPDVLGATFCGRDGFCFPSTIINDTLNYCKARFNGQFHLLTNAEVTGAKHGTAVIKSLITTRGEIPADWFVNCSAAWAGRMETVLGCNPLPVFPIKRFLYFFAGLAQTLNGRMKSKDMPMTVLENGIYCRPEGQGNQLMAGWAPEIKPELDFTDEDQDKIPPAFNPKGSIESYGHQLWSLMAEFLPPLVDLPGIQTCTSGYYADSLDQGPIIGFDYDQLNLVHACALGGHGVMMGPYVAEVVRQLIINECKMDAMKIADDDYIYNLAPYSAMRFSRQEIKNWRELAPRSLAGVI